MEGVWERLDIGMDWDLTNLRYFGVANGDDSDEGGSGIARSSNRRRSQRTAPHH